MKIEISKIHIAKRIRKDTVKINELAEDIRSNGLICPIAVMPKERGEYQLLAGLRRLKAAQSLGWTDIDVNIVSPADAESELKIEYSENEQRENFTLAERMEYAVIIEEIEKAKALERMMSGKTDPVPKRAQGRTRDIVSEKVGMGRTNYECAKYIANNAPEVIERIDNGEIALRTAYDEVRAAKQEETPSAPSAKPKIKPADYERLQNEFDALKTEKADFVSKFSMADHKREMLETQLRNTELQWRYEREGKDEMINSLRQRVAELEAELSAANAKITELEGMITNANTD